MIFRTLSIGHSIPASTKNVKTHFPAKENGFFAMGTGFSVSCKRPAVRDEAHAAGRRLGCTALRTYGRHTSLVCGECD